eukprot:TRINITY_DN13125_c0_g1_i1.p1 TRINITY_DN13125_c0_g1~~TRINITY_DN13125_c0_g1_i1.p1  ORF type:complete len:248 (+),score=53.04 TRINITY_DN13125_c0_g1_i1:136-879(+)
MEVCVDSIESALNAARGGASRLEVCSSLAEGGLTPSTGLLRVITDNVTIPCFAMIRPRGGDFVYSELELQVMEKDVDMMIECGALGVVFGCLNTDGEVDEASVSRLVTTAKNKLSTVGLTFHRAIDMARDINKSAKTVQQLGFERILTSGGHKTALEGVHSIAELVKELDCVVMPGGGINEENLEEIQTKTKCVEFHASARIKRDSKMEFQNEACSMGSNSQEFFIMVTSTEKVANLVKIYKNTFFK